jgi:hypothetical protein
MAVKVGTNISSTENFCVSFRTFTWRHKEMAMKVGTGTGISLGSAEYS